jgi:Protein of unknown function (DUF2950)
MIASKRQSNYMSGMIRRDSPASRRLPVWRTVAAPIGAVALLAWVSGIAHAQSSHRTYPTAEAAVEALVKTVKAGNLDELIAIFGPEGKEIVASSDPATGRKNREVFTAAAAEHRELVDAGPNRKTLVIGNEEWPFPVPLVKDANGWHFDTAAGKEEILDRRIGSNELAAIETVRAYVTAQRRYAEQGHDGKRSGLYAATFRSDPGKQNGLYWATAKGQKRSPLGDLVAQAATEGTAIGADSAPQTPLHGYYYKILTAQGPAAAGGAKKYVVNGDMSGGFALVAWPAQYDASGVMTFIVSSDGIVYQKDLGEGTDAAARKMTEYNPDKTWQPVK